MLKEEDEQGEEEKGPVGQENIRQGQKTSLAVTMHHHRSAGLIKGSCGRPSASANQWKDQVER